MKVIRSARFAALAMLVALLVNFLLARPGVRVSGVLLPRQVWLDENGWLWMLHGWLWLLAIFAWMVLMVSFLWTYSPAHRITTMLQSGLMIIAAVLGIGGVTIWMNVLPMAAAGPDAATLVPVIDGLALTPIGAGLFMGGAVTGWICVDLMRLDAIPRSWLVPGLLAGLCGVPAPFLLPDATLLAAGAILLILWCAFLGSRRKMPGAYAEWL